MCLEGQLVAHGQSAADLALRRVLSLHIELLPADTADRAVWKVEGHLRSGIFPEVVIILEFMKIFAGCDCIKARTITLECSKRTRLALQSPRYQWLGRRMILIWKRNIGRSSFRSGRIYEVIAVPLDKPVKLEIRWDLLRC